MISCLPRGLGRPLTLCDDQPTSVIHRSRGCSRAVTKADSIMARPAKAPLTGSLGTPERCRCRARLSRSAKPRTASSRMPRSGENAALPFAGAPAESWTLVTWRQESCSVSRAERTGAPGRVTPVWSGPMATEAAKEEVRPIAAAERQPLRMAGTAHLADYGVATEDHPSFAQAEPGPGHRDELLVLHSFFRLELSHL